MSITIVTGDILNSQVEAIVNPVNCVGVMGKGLALQFKNKFPTNFSYYERCCKEGRLTPARMATTIYSDNTIYKYIINFPTKRHWKDNSRLEDIELGLISLVKEVEKYKIKSIAIPPLGCGLGGLDYNVVKQLIIKHFDHLENLEVLMYQPFPSPRA